MCELNLPKKGASGFSAEKRGKIRRIGQRAVLHQFVAGCFHSRTGWNDNKWKQLHTSGNAHLKAPLGKMPAINFFGCLLPASGFCPLDNGSFLMGIRPGLERHLVTTTLLLCHVFQSAKHDREHGGYGMNSSGVHASKRIRPVDWR